MKTKFQLTAIIEKSDDGWYVGQLQEIPAVISQGKTIQELLENLHDALELLIDTQREMTLKEYSGKKIIKRKLHYVYE
ncbi:MAG: type II toxin-antitoxin system HicB family antitoxin [Bacteroidia bacterium]|nr:type II toxin-antitoxin system HicB family antitoxin [Bacteroidia bacterium]